jgi:hypothetical protein
MSLISLGAIIVLLGGATYSSQFYDDTQTISDNKVVSTTWVTQGNCLFPGTSNGDLNYNNGWTFSSGCSNKRIQLNLLNTCPDQQIYIKKIKVEWPSGCKLTESTIGYAIVNKKTVRNIIWSSKNGVSPPYTIDLNSNKPGFLLTNQMGSQENSYGFDTSMTAKNCFRLTFTLGDASQKTVTLHNMCKTDKKGKEVVTNPCTGTGCHPCPCPGTL